jgi:hypothetical protein
MSEVANSSLSILVIGFDPYCDVWPYFDYFFLKNWPNCDYPKIFVSNKLPFESVNGFLNVQTLDDLSISGRILAGLRNIDTKYVLVLLEDYIVQKIPSPKDLDKLLSYLSKENISFCQLDDLTKSHFRKGASSFEDKKIRRISDKKRSYRINLQPGIWLASFLREACSHPLIRPWDFEASLCEGGQNFEVQKKQKVALIPNGLFRFVSFIEKGKYTREAVAFVESCPLPRPKRPFWSRKAEKRERLFTFISSITPYWAKRILKGIGRKFGHSYFSK